jgi:tetraacyldisaccharide 4'-kinase
MRAPGFWWRTPPSLLAHLLRPPGLLYGAIAGHRMNRPGERAPVPVICIGNLTAGGAGKTPTALMVAGLLRAAGKTPVFLSRGYGGRLAGPVRVEAHHGAEEVGDEPLLLARSAPTVVSRDRPAGARLAQEAGAGVVVMDDGLQNPSLIKDLALAVVDGATGIGNGLPLPAGPLRAPMSAQWPRIDALLVIGDGSPGDAIAAEASARGKSVLRGRLVPDPAMATRLRGERVLAFAGIGRPQKFFDTLARCGAVVEVARPFPDHHRFSADEVAALRSEASARGLHLVTTEKDAARLAHGEEFRDLKTGLLTLPVHLEVEDPAALRDELVRRIGSDREGARPGAGSPSA